ncbi:FADH(2)-oxidizing methylenetetrahydrofolate--tRNA-(uracil(54)-C(5))-methyltransferase TrmFO [Tepidanaerobacter acetatoxydans]|uniref:FADH(2)-oxidizing methylenetetrahydrofolate--tRNA-(uracil(54)-C(5))- methyltransferase TrmFO n=1 Tax=Tepidanaerobacter acetatoxydans TaxID=499229 RepID=UPI001BD4E0EA|nr:FADH(2)-oxidizing methylenetetrahydrofolate--tRNA-(uracil(54)-C(5))-methyltransferase TrmFO [Tepidanaerobacter acetatoxydans]
MERVNVIGGGLAGCEAAWHLAQNGIKVDLFEMRPVKTTPAHHTGKLAELVCSNSFRSNEITNAAGLLKQEMRAMDSIIMKVADMMSIPAGSALAVDRELFSSKVTELIKNHPNIELHIKEICKIPSTPTIIATGPLTSEGMSTALAKLLKKEYLYFYDAAAPIITGESLDWDKAFWGSRYNKGEADYVNLPFTHDEYDTFYNELINAETYSLKEFEKPIFFEGCMPVEVMAKRGYKTLLFGPLKPVGIFDPATGKQPYAVAQLRKENAEGTLFNMVGFQTSLKWGEQKRVFGLIPGMEKAEFVRYGFIHRNTFIASPLYLKPTLEFKDLRGLFFAGQITGVEGYIESAASGIVAGINMKRFIRKVDPIALPLETMTGALLNFITSSSPENFQPMKANFGILPPLQNDIKSSKLKKILLSQRALDSIRQFVEYEKVFSQENNKTIYK